MDDDSVGRRHVLALATHTRVGLPVCHEIFGYNANAKGFGNPKVEIPIFAPLHPFLLGSCKVKPYFPKGDRPQ
jgi:hypothetical protein